jgi:uncharacterized protein (TIGR02246 family)
MRWNGLILIMVLFCRASLVSAQDPASTGLEKAGLGAATVGLDGAPIQAAVKAYEAAYNLADAEALAGLWTEDAVYSNQTTGKMIQSKKSIVEEFVRAFASSKKSTMSLSTDSLQFLSPTVAVEHGTSKIVTPGQPAEAYLYTAVYVKQSGKWLLDRVTDQEVAAPHHSENLKSLEWMVGTWRGGSSDSMIRIDCNWTSGKSFLTRAFTVVEGGESFTGTQIIGWDPIRSVVRSWTFDENGTFSEGTWLKKEDQWTITNQGIVQDGTKAAMVNIMTKIDDSTFSWKTIDRVSGGEILSNLGEVVLRRQ